MKLRDAYGNTPIYSPEGVLMFHTGGRKLEFYLRNNLLFDYSNGYKLTFIPKGLGHNSIGRDSLLLTPRINQCVISGEKDLKLLNRHHIVPVIFRKWMPTEIKSNNHRFVVFTREDLHSQYTIAEQKYYNDLAERYDTISFREFQNNKAKNSGVLKRTVNALLHYSHLMPLDRLGMLEQTFVGYSSLEPSFKNYKLVLDEIEEEQKKYYKRSSFDFGKLIIEKVTDFREFEMLWLDHFIATTNPKFLPMDLKVLVSNEVF